MIPGSVGVVGAGAMGSGIIEVVARSGVAVVGREISVAALDAGRERVEGSLAKAVSRDKITADDRDETLGRVSWTTDWGIRRAARFDSPARVRSPTFSCRIVRFGSTLT